MQRKGTYVLERHVDVIIPYLTNNVEYYMC
jgi:hypothetical protein